MTAQSAKAAEIQREIFGDAMKVIDQMVLGWETRLNKEPSKSPFEGMYEGSLVKTVKKAA